MTILDASICWAVLAPLSTGDLEQVAAREWARDAPYAIDPPPWQTVAGDAGYNALVSRSPGAEGSDRRFAEILSRLAPGRTVHALWLDPERRQAFAWKDGREVSPPPASLDDVAAQAGFSIAADVPSFTAEMSAAVVEGASIGEVRAALGEFADEPWLHVQPGPAGVSITATDGPLGTQAWDVAEALPSATVYFVQQWADAFEVVVLRGAEEVGLYRVPPLSGHANALPDIKGEVEPQAILRILGISG
ncbi:hypothetical protein [Polyangium aurulentum]|uniref:hypothetical protein n=1 Tax=Polyangium aurulentum TaxID=2567896 RepID=UPI0010ADE0C5|nr:hypothetical protein [Polyangium aurulentum]UQA59895.1 hypothetical protein E8A73_005225 [Polyangium aurulentum]